MARDCKQNASGANNAPLGGEAQDREYDNLMQELGEGPGGARGRIDGGQNRNAPWAQGATGAAAPWAKALPAPEAAGSRSAPWQSGPAQNLPPGMSAPGYGAPPGLAPPPSSSTYGPPPGASSYGPPPTGSMGAPRRSNVLEFIAHRYSFWILWRLWASSPASRTTGTSRPVSILLGPSYAYRVDPGITGTGNAKETDILRLLHRIHTAGINEIEMIVTGDNKDGEVDRIVIDVMDNISLFFR